jgi:hypothetical protein
MNSQELTSAVHSTARALGLGESGLGLQLNSLAGAIEPMAATAGQD